MKKTIEGFLKQSPKVRKKDIEAINGLFSSYLFRSAASREIWTTCCRKHGTLPEDHPFWAEEHIREPKHYWIKSEREKRDQTSCPFCGKKGTVKDLKYTGKRKNLWELQRFAVLRWDGNAFWIICAEAKKDYERRDHLCFAPTINTCATYRFGAEAVDYLIRPWWGSYRRVETEKYSSFGKKAVDRPVNWNTEEGLTYAVLWPEEIKKSPIRWCRAEEWIESEHEIVRFAHLAHAYPRQVEMLMKAGMAEVIRDRIDRGVKHAAVLDWEAGDFRSGFKVPPEIVRGFLRNHVPGDRNIRVLELWKELNRKSRVSLEETEEVYPYLSVKRTALKLAKRWNVDPIRLYRYLDGQNHCHVSAMFQAWEDYVTLGEQQGLKLYRTDVIFPENLGNAHDAVVAKRNENLARERAAELKRQEKKRQEAAKKAEEEYTGALRPKLEAKFAWEDGEYAIIVPESKQAILDEGRELQHCVGGYADRHMQGKTVILFMRRKAAPDKPWITIEMKGTELKQIHGFRNEGLYSTGGRTAPDPREVYRAFLDPWLEWVAKGSRRKKDGTPIVPRSKKKEAAA